MAATTPSPTRSLGSSLRTLLKVKISGGERAFLLNPGTQSVGRGIRCDIRINHPQVSRIQAVLNLQVDGRVQMIDGDGQARPSTNGTIVNGSRVQECWLQSGDEIQLGRDVVAQFHQLNLRQGNPPTSSIPASPRPTVDLGDSPTEIVPSS